ncbi:hypothetical protein BDF22DRAFT_131488 [Syncephalis plumigaleata]|nr:hypothetical protein BDF22DRAFT_131488 [Syncephalis plumigaleata]
MNKEVPMEASIVHAATVASESADTYIFSYVNGVTEHVNLSRSDVQARLTGIQHQYMAFTIVSLIFIRNLYMIAKTFRRQTKNLSAWCILAISIMGASAYPLTVASGALVDISCAILASYITLILCVSTVCNSVILLHKAYLALLRQRWILAVGSLTILLQVGMIGYTLWVLPTAMEPYIGCVVNYTSPMLIAWLITVFPINLFFSGIFSYVAYSQYKIYGTEAWRRLVKDGLRTMCLVVLCNLVCGVFVSSHTFGNATQVFFVIDWVFTSTMLANHYSSISKTASAIAKSAQDNGRLRTDNNLYTTYAEFGESITTYHGRIHDNTTFTSLY